ncbi:C2 and GRAM domain-containing protein At1g03370-like [Phalaenopsis equestris]|uniref:C2 and GRAM domain-containing protein At1g03370-like n=1 Tax=Phalaenopsis equestris TaxID=78828 RepID=UPI0009E3D9D8|nr:C2 and GRAM domain-containing protein At1g03370-like [Phalaenopsis equestris]
MRLYVQVIEARGLPAMDLNGLSDPYVRLQLGKQRAKTKVVKKSLNPLWDEEFSFRVGDLREELIVSVLDEDKYFSDDFLGQVKLPLSKVLDADNLSLGSVWYQLQPRSKKSKNQECGEIHLTLSLSHINSLSDGTPPQTFSEDLTSNSDKSSELKRLSVDSNGKTDSYSVSEAEEADPDKEEKSQSRAFFDRIFQVFTGKSADITRPTGRDIDFVEVIQEEPPNPEVNELADDAVSNSTFDESVKILESKDQGGEMPENLAGGVILDQSYAVSPSELNTVIFSTNSNFLQSLADIQGTTDLNIEAWIFENGGESLKRVVTYMKAATKLVKAVKATEEQTYLKADGKNYAVLASVSTPDVPFGSSFRCEVLYCIMPGPQLPSEEQSSRLVVSWRINFFQSTMMKGMIENGAKQGLKDSYVQFAEALSKIVKPLDLKDVGSSKEQILASLQTEQESDWKLACRIFGNFTVISSIFVGLYVTVHILLANRSTIQGLEFSGLDLPDSIGEVVVCGVLVLQGERVLKMIGRFLHARKQRGSDHGIKAQGDGWLLTVALIEGSNLAAVDSSGYSDPYVVFTCHGMTKTSSIKFQTLDPHWNEIFEFDAMIDPPSTMDINVYDFDGPFDEAVSLGHTEVNFLKSNLSELADVWIPLEGKLAQACQSKLHLRIFLHNTRGVQVVSDYLTKMEKEVGKKINLRSPQTNSAFQKLFSLPPEEFLINDFTCHLKRKMPIQGRLFLSPRIIGFYTNLFGHKIKFFFLWEDIDDIQIVPPSLTSMGSPSLLIILRRGRGLDARHGAKSLDPDGRLKFQFQSFVSFSVANRTIMALWKAKSLSPEQKVRLVEEESEEKELRSEESGSFLGIEDAKMSEVFSSIVPVPLNSLMEIFEGDSFEQKVMEKVGCVDYSASPWESVSPDVHQRQVNYKFDKNISRYGGEVTSTQQRSPLHDKNGWLIEEVMTLQGVLLGDYFTLHLRYQIDDLQSKSKACHVHVSLGIAWLKSTKHQKRITKNVIANSSTRLKEMFRLVEKEFSTGK